MNKRATLIGVTTAISISLLAFGLYQLKTQNEITNVVVGEKASNGQITKTYKAKDIVLENGATELSSNIADYKISDFKVDDKSSEFKLEVTLKSDVKASEFEPALVELVCIENSETKITEYESGYKPNEVYKKGDTILINYFVKSDRNIISKDSKGIYLNFVDGDGIISRIYYKK